MRGCTITDSPKNMVWHGSALLALAFVATPALAQSGPTREEILRQTDRPLPPATAPSIEGTDSIPRAPCPLADPQFANVRFTLRAVNIHNLGAIDPAEVSPAWTGQIGQEVPVSEICTIRDRVAAILTRAGYLVAVRVPEQTISDGTVQLDLLAARLTGVQVRGNIGADEHQLQRYLSRIVDQPLFNRYDAERYLLLANSMPGVAARLTLRPSDAPGDVIGEVIAERTPVNFDFNAQNYGSNAVGRYGGIARLRFNGLTGLGDQTTLGFYTTSDFREQQVLQGSHEFRIGGEGLTVGTNVTYAWTRPSLPGNLDLRSRTFVWSSYARYPVVLRESHSLWVGGGFDWIDQTTTAAGIGLNRDKLRILWARADMNWIDPKAFTGAGGYTPAEPRWSANFALEARQGIAGLGASPHCSANLPACYAGSALPTSRIDGRPDGTVFRLNGEFDWRPDPKVTIALTPRIQYAPKALLPYEEYSPGNYTVARGYDPGTVSGDSGVGSGVELRIGSIVPHTVNSVAIQPFAFVDAAWVWNDDPTFTGRSPERLVSMGGGARITYGNRARIDLTVAQPLRQTFFETRRSPLRFLISLTTQFGFGR